MSDWRVKPGGRLAGTVRVPGDKSVSHRAVLIGALADGATVVRNLLRGEDVRATVNAVRALGVAVDEGGGEVGVHGRGLHGLRAPKNPIDCGNAGTAMRLLAGVLAAQPFASELRGDASLSARPMERVAAPLRKMGADISTAPGGVPPLAIGAARGPLRGMRHELGVASAQVKSALLLAGLYADAAVTVAEPAATRDHTEIMLRNFGAAVTTAGAAVTIAPGAGLRAAAVTVPGDMSSAAFFIAGAAIAGELTVSGVGMNPTRTAIIDLMRKMGADVTVSRPASAVSAAESTADVTVRRSALGGIAIGGAAVTTALDEVPALAIAAAAARGKTVIRGAAELRVKESDRIATVAAGLKALGVTVEEHADGMTITGVDAAGGGRFPGGVVHSGGDHRIAMAFAMAALAAAGEVTVTDCGNVATSFPGFAAAARAAGLRIDERA